jgi:hypothetical protein
MTEAKKMGQKGQTNSALPGAFPGRAASEEGFYSLGGNLCVCGVALRGLIRPPQGLKE